jgi:hypothetical protein
MHPQGYLRNYLQIARRSGPLASGTQDPVRTSPSTAEALAVQTRHGKCPGAKLLIPSSVTAVSINLACCRVAVLPCAAMLGSLRWPSDVQFRVYVLPHQVEPSQHFRCAGPAVLR